MRKIYLAMLLTFPLLLGGCGKADNLVQVKVHDGYMTSQYSVPKGTTVRNTLKRGEIVIHDGDEITPSPSEKVEDSSEITIGREATIQFTLDGTDMPMTLKGKKVKDLLTKQNIKLGKYDLINHDLEAYLENDMHVEVIRRYKVSIQCDGKTEKKITEAKTVRELLEKEKISLGKNDRIKPSLDDKLKTGTKIVIQRVDIKKEKEKVDIPYETSYENSSSMYSGETKVKREGENGQKEITYEITYVDGKEDKKKVINEKTIKEPVNKIILRGTKSRPKKSSGGSKKKKRYKTIVDCDGSVKRVPY